MKLGKLAVEVEVLVSYGMAVGGQVGVHAFFSDDYMECMDWIMYGKYAQQCTV